MFSFARVFWLAAKLSTSVYAELSTFVRRVLMLGKQPFGVEIMEEWVTPERLHLGHNPKANSQEDHKTFVSRSFGTKQRRTATAL